jgi:ribosomal protein S18 acetylase RimI-like enzyme
MRSIAVPVTLRPITAQDTRFLCRLYAGTRTDELSVLDWSNTQKETFLRMQFDAQHTHYMAKFPEASFQVIELDGEPVGRLYVDRRPSEIRIVDIALLPEYRGRGIGTLLIKQVLREGQISGRPVGICVESYNRALTLYHRLGFRKIDETEVYSLMKWVPDETTSSTSTENLEEEA